MLEDQGHLPGGEEALPGIIAGLLEGLGEGLVQLDPMGQPVEGRLWGDLRGVGPGQLALAVGSDSHFAHVRSFLAKVRIFMLINK